MALARRTYGRVPWMWWESFCQYWKGWKWSRSVDASRQWLGNSHPPWYWTKIHVFLGHWTGWRGDLTRTMLDGHSASLKSEWLVAEAALEAVRALQVHWEDVRKGNPYPRRLKASKSGPQIGTVTKARKMVFSASSAVHDRFWKWHVWEQRLALSSILNVYNFFFGNDCIFIMRFKLWFNGPVNWGSKDSLSHCKHWQSDLKVPKVRFCFQDIVCKFSHSVSSPGKASTVGVFCNKEDTAEQAAAPSEWY